MTPWYKDIDCLLCVTLLTLGLMLVLIGHAGAQTPPYSCRLLYEEQHKCGFGACDKRVITRLTKECLRDGGRP